MVIKQSCSGSHDNGPEMLQEMEETINMKLLTTYIHMKLKYLFSGMYLNKTFESCRIGGDRFSTSGSTALALVVSSVSSVSSVPL